MVHINLNALISLVVANEGDEEEEDDDGLAF